MERLPSNLDVLPGHGFPARCALLEELLLEVRVAEQLPIALMEQVVLANLLTVDNAPADRQIRIQDIMANVSRLRT